MNREASGATVAALILAMGAPALAQPATRPVAGTQPRPLQQYVEVMLRCLEQSRGQMDTITGAAEAVAQRWIAGGELCAAGDVSFTDEAFYRAGGLIGLRRVAPARSKFSPRVITWEEVPQGAIILYGLHRNADPGVILFDDINHLAGDDHTVVLFGSASWASVRKAMQLCRRRLPAGNVLFIDTQLPADTRLTAAGIAYADYAPTAEAVYLWTFTAELIAACTRQGKMPGIWPSGAIPNYQPWEARYQDIRFHDDIGVAPIAPGALGRRYLDIMREQLEACRASQPQVEAAAKVLAAVPPDRTVYVMVESHLLAEETWLPVELPNWLPVQRGWRWERAARTRESGDAIVWVGYLDWPAGLARSVAQRNSPLVAMSVRAPGQNVREEPLRVPATAPATRAVSQANRVNPAEAALPAHVIWIPAPWRYPDAVVEIPGYPLPACPTSGIIQGTLLWGLVGESVRLAAR